jgi:hypothetical protein
MPSSSRDLKEIAVEGPEAISRIAGSGSSGSAWKELLRMMPCYDIATWWMP